VGFPIRRFTDQSLFAAPHDLSQRTTSFIASQRQGIHRIPLWHLIALIIDATARQQFETSPRKKTSRLDRLLFKDQFASNTPEGIAVKLCPQTEALARTEIPRRQSDVFPLHDVNEPARKAGETSKCSDECRAIAQSGGARRDRTDDLLLAKQALSQLSYGPFQGSEIRLQESKCDPDACLLISDF
jgi:hypothetical protein